MDTITISANHQIVIPKAIRSRLSLRPGQRMNIRLDGDKVIIDTKSHVKKLYGSMKGSWGQDSTKHIDNLRSNWDQ